MFKSVLVANRGEIAVRIARTLRTMGVRSVVTAAIPDRKSLAVRSADAWVLLEGYSAAETYLDSEAIIAAAKSEGCEAIHPGYGFLSERPEFAEACAAAGITFVGPPPAVLRTLGDKAAARQLAVANGVPVVPGWDGPDDDASLSREAEKLGFPVMIKARGGGGGRGMREVHDPQTFAEAVEGARREAQAAFGDPRLLLEKLVTQAHHVEVQIVADAHGNVIHLGERDCSVQRRHQKLIEESPSPVVDDVLRSELTGAALRLARAIGYVNAGTFEFLVGEPAADGRRPYYFLEVNPRLQVEHPVTEMVTGLDLVELQLRVAAGELLPIRQKDVGFEGHAIEFRINAEDPWDGFKPSSGRITRMWALDDDPRMRDDSGYAVGDVVPPHYDSLLKKVIVHAPSRDEALGCLVWNTGTDDIRGVATNLGLAQVLVDDDEFRAGKATVEWLEGKLDALLVDAPKHATVWVAAAVGCLALARSLGSPRFEPRWIGASEATLWLNDGRETREVRLRYTGPWRGVAHVTGEDVEFELPDSGRGLESVSVRLSGEWHSVLPSTFGPAAWKKGGGVTAGFETPPGPGSATLVDIMYGGHSCEFALVPPPPLPRRAHSEVEGATAVVAPLAGTVAAIRVSPGDAVAAGDLLLVLEAMKMEHRVTAPAAGIILTVNVSEAAVVREGDVLVELA